MQNLREILSHKKILVTGGTGSIGSEIVRQLLQYNPSHIRVYSRDESKHFHLQNELKKIQSEDNVRFLIGDIRDKERLNFAFKDVDVVFHVAALKHVPFCEYNPFEAIKTNIFGTQNIIDLALKHRIERFVAISSDKAVNPNTVMGISKLMMERMVTSSYNYMGASQTKFAVVRFGNVLNSRGSVIPTWISQIRSGGPVTVTDKKMTRFFMSIPDAVNLVFSALSMMEGQEIIVLKMEKKNIFELAQEVIKKYSGNRKIPIQIMGAREREKIEEKLFTQEESHHMIETDKFYIILPTKELMKMRKSSYS